MAQIRGSGLVEQRFRSSSGSLLPAGFMGPAILLLLATSWLQGQSAPNNSSTQKHTPTTSSASSVTQEVGTAPVAPELPPPTAQQKPPQPPAVAWDGKLLTIDADNCRLADILVAVRDQTGVSIEIPPTALSERVFVHLGPGPARDILSDLLYGTQFDYIVEAADDDPDTLRKVVLTVRGRGDSSEDVVVAGATNSGEGIGGNSTLPATADRGGAIDGRSRPDGVRMMPGWAGPGKPAFQAEAEAALAAEQAAAQEAAAAKDSAAAQDSAVAQDAAAAQVAAAAQDVVAAKDSVGAQDSPVAAETSDATKASNSSPSTSDTGSDSNDSSGVGQAIQNMTRMFEQRRQIQAKQNQLPPPSPN